MTKRKSSVNNEGSDLLLRRLRKKYWYFIISVLLLGIIVFPVIDPANNDLWWLWFFVSLFIFSILGIIFLRCPFCNKVFLWVPFNSPPEKKIHLSIISPYKCNNCLRDLRVKKKEETETIEK